uniref:Uncharacterized protein n=1 Tax=Burkholderia cenocepacia TaxID=95486 RepID=A0A071MU08_9BURK
MLLHLRASIFYLTDRQAIFLGQDHVAFSATVLYQSFMFREEFVVGQRASYSGVGILCRSYGDPDTKPFEPFIEIRFADEAAAEHDRTREIAIFDRQPSGGITSNDSAATEIVEQLLFVAPCGIGAQSFIVRMKLRRNQQGRLRRGEKIGGWELAIAAGDIPGARCDGSISFGRDALFQFSWAHVSIHQSQCASVSIPNRVRRVICVRSLSDKA